MNGFSSYQVGRLVGMSPNTIRGLHRRGFAGPEYGKRWSLRQVVGLRIMRDARRQGASIMAAVAAYDIVRGIGGATLALSFAAGSRYLVLFGDSMILNLVTHERAFDPALKADAMRQTVPLVIVDVQSVVAEITKRATENFQSPVAALN